MCIRDSNYTEDRIKERIQGRNARRRQMQNGRKNISLISLSLIHIWGC